MVDVRKRFIERNPNAPVGWEHGVETIGDEYPGQRPMPVPPEQRPGSFESYFPDVEENTGRTLSGRKEIEEVLLEVMDADITEQEILQALDDPMFGGPLSGTASNAEINERVYGRRYADRMEQIRELGRMETPGHRGWPAGTETWAEPPTRHLPEAKRGGISGLRHRVGQAARGAGQAARGAGITALKAIRNRLPAIIAAGAATAATSHPVSALADVALSPTQLGSGELPEESRFSPEEKMKYYEDLMNLERELGVGQHRPSILQPSREINGPSIRSSYPMRRMRR